MNTGDSVIYHQKPCVVLDANLEGCSLEEGQVLLEDVTHYFACRGRVRHLADSNAVGHEAGGNFSDSPPA